MKNKKNTEHNLHISKNPFKKDDYLIQSNYKKLIHQKN
jgi:hypothetical protein